MSFSLAKKKHFCQEKGLPIAKKCVFWEESTVQFASFSKTCISNMLLKGKNFPVEKDMILFTLLNAPNLLLHRFFRIESS